jgi:hypothetical protein
VPSKTTIRFIEDGNSTRYPAPSTIETFVESEFLALDEDELGDVEGSVESFPEDDD